MERSRTFFGDKDQVSSGEGKWQGQEGSMRVILQNSNY